MLSLLNKNTFENAKDSIWILLGQATTLRPVCLEGCKWQPCVLLSYSRKPLLEGMQAPALHYSDHLAELQPALQPPTEQDNHSLQLQRGTTTPAGMQLPSWPGQLCGDQKDQGRNLQQRGGGIGTPAALFPRTPYPSGCCQDHSLYFKERREASLVILVTGLWPPAALHPVREKGKNSIVLYLSSSQT